MQVEGVDSFDMYAPPEFLVHLFVSWRISRKWRAAQSSRNTESLRTSSLERRQVHLALSQVSSYIKEALVT